MALPAVAPAAKEPAVCTGTKDHSAGGGDRKIHIARELTKKFEEHINSDIDNIINIFEEREYKGEFCIIVKGNNIKKLDLIDKNKLREELFFLVNNGLSLSKASKYLAKKNNLTKKFIYNLNE